MTKLAFVDLETTGLDHQRHEVWDVGIIMGDSRDKEVSQEYQWFLPVDLKTADPMALTVGKFYERHPAYKTDLDHDEWGEPKNLIPKGHDINNGNVVSLGWAAHKISRLTNGAHLVGNVVSFDANFLTRLLKNNGGTPTWHYHLIDCEALVAGALGQAPPWKSRELSEAIGVAPPTDEEAHSALTDAWWAFDLYWAGMQYYDAHGRHQFTGVQR